MNDPTETKRRKMSSALNSAAAGREALEAEHGQVWSTAQLTRDFHVNSFAAPFVVVDRKSDGARGTLCFQHYPRFYFNFQDA